MKYHEQARGSCHHDYPAAEQLPPFPRVASCLSHLPWSLNPSPPSPHTRYSPPPVHSRLSYCDLRHAVTIVYRKA